jgi:hypothetical protein
VLEKVSTSVQSLDAQLANCDLFFQEKQSSGSTAKPKKLFFASMRLCPFWNSSPHRHGRAAATCALCGLLGGDVGVDAIAPFVT